MKLLRYLSRPARLLLKAEQFRDVEPLVQDDPSVDPNSIAYTFEELGVAVLSRRADEVIDTIFIYPQAASLAEIDFGLDRESVRRIFGVPGDSGDADAESGRGSFDLFFLKEASIHFEYTAGEGGLSTVTIMAPDAGGGSEEPQFEALPADDPAMVDAHARAAETGGLFRELVENKKGDVFLAKLGFRDPSAPESAGEEAMLFVWLQEARWDRKAKKLVAAIGEVPKALEGQVEAGQWLSFEPNDVFDWLVIDAGRGRGGYSLRATRERQAAGDRAAYDAYVGVTDWAPAD